MPSPPPIHTHHKLLKTYTTLYTLLATALPITLLLLIWHISTTYLVENFDMPYIWAEDFVKAQLEGGGWAVWGLVLGLVCCFDFGGGG